MSWRSTAVLSAAIVLAIGLPIVFSQRAQENTAVATTVDAKDFDQLWLDLQFLQDEAPELDAAEYKRRVVRKTARYLELDSDQELRFAEVVDLELGDLRDARARMEKINLQTTHSSENPLAVIALRNAWRRWQHEQKMASDRLLDALQSTPRHRLLAEKRLLWLLRLDYSMRPEARGR